MSERSRLLGHDRVEAVLRLVDRHGDRDALPAQTRSGEGDEQALDGGFARREVGEPPVHEIATGEPERLEARGTEPPTDPAGGGGARGHASPLGGGHPGGAAPTAFPAVTTEPLEDLGGELHARNLCQGGKHVQPGGPILPRPLGGVVKLLRLALAGCLWGIASPPVLAQDADLDPILFADLGGAQVEDVTASSFQIYRIPLSYRLRSLEDRPWGLRLTFPVSLGSYRVEAIDGLDEFVEGIRAASVIPGVEFEVPVGDRWVLKPFAEIGIGTDSTSGETDVLYGTGLRAVARYRPGDAKLTLGSSAIYKKPSSSRENFDSYSKLEVGLDARRPLGFSIGRRGAEGGLFGIVRRYSRLDVARLGEGPYEVDGGYEVGFSFSTDPVMALGKLEIPWIGLGYQFGDLFGGIRLYLSFPF